MLLFECLCSLRIYMLKILMPYVMVPEGSLWRYLGHEDGAVMYGLVYLQKRHKGLSSHVRTQ